MNLYDPSLAVQTYSQGLQQANADQMALAQAPTPAQIFLDRLRQSKQDQLQRDQFDWQKQYQGRMLQNTAERNAAWAENNKLKNQIGLYNADTKRQLGEAANELRQQANAIRSAHYGNVDPARVQALQAQANLMGSKADEIDSLHKQLKESSERLEEAAKRKEEFTSALAHDVRSPLQTIRIAIELDKSRESKKIGKTLDETIDIVENILTVNRLRFGRRKDKSNQLDEALPALITETIAMLADKAGANPVA